MTEKHFIVATAGHVDHGKTALVKALTGTDPDRLPEEKTRGITIDLGFAQLELAAPASDSQPDLTRSGLPTRRDSIQPDLTRSGLPRRRDSIQPDLTGSGLP